jgi:hypothetical protein
VDFNGTEMFLDAPADLISSLTPGHDLDSWR